MYKEMKRLKKILLTLAIVWLGVNVIPSADCVQAANVKITTSKSKITMNNAGLQAATSLEVSVENEPAGANTVITLENSEVINFYKRKSKSIKLYNTESYVTEDNKNVDEDDDDYDDDEGLYLNIIPLTAGKSSVVVNVYSSAQEVLATKTIPVEVRSVTPKLSRSDHAKNKNYKLAKTANWTCESGAWERGNFYISNVPYGSKVTLTVSNNKMYKYINSYFSYKWKKMSKKKYVLKEDPYPYDYSYAFSLYPVKSGKATIKVTIESAGKTTTFKIKNKVNSYKNPLAKLIINGKDKTKVYNKEQYLRSGTNLDSSTTLNLARIKAKTITGQITMKKGYKLVSVKSGKKTIKLTQSGGSYYFSVQTSKLNGVLKITYKDKKGKTRYLYNNEV